MTFRDCTLNEFNRKYPGRSQKRTLKNGSWLRKLYTTIIYANHVLTLKLDTRVCVFFIVIYRCLLAHTNGVSKLRTEGTCALPSPLPFHYVMAKIVPVLQLVAHVESCTLDGRSYRFKSKFFRLDGLLLFRIIMGRRCALCELCYNIN